MSVISVMMPPSAQQVASLCQCHFFASIVLSANIVSEVWTTGVFVARLLAGIGRVIIS